MVPGMRCPDAAALIQNRNQGFPTIEKPLLGSKTHISCLSYFLWLENREGGCCVGSRLGGEAASRRQRGRRGQAGAEPGDRGLAAGAGPGQGEERRAVK